MTRTWDLSNSDRLKLLSIVELRDLLQDEDKIHHIISSSPKVGVTSFTYIVWVFQTNRNPSKDASLRAFLSPPIQCYAN